MFYTINFLKISSTFIICVGHSFLHLLRLFSFFLNTLTFFKITGYLVCRMSPQFGFTWFLPEKIQVIHFWQEYHTSDPVPFSVYPSRGIRRQCVSWLVMLLWWLDYGSVPSRLLPSLLASISVSLCYVQYTSSDPLSRSLFLSSNAPILFL